MAPPLRARLLPPSAPPVPLPAEAAALGKPLIVEEFGAEQNRDAYFKAVLGAVEASLKSGGALKGGMFWQFYLPGQVGEAGGLPCAALCCAVLCCAVLAPTLAYRSLPHTPWRAPADRQRGGGRRRRALWHLPCRLHLCPHQGQCCGSAAALLRARPQRHVQQEGPRRRGRLHQQRVRTGRGHATGGGVYLLLCAAPAPSRRASLHRFEGPGCDIDVNECVRGTAGCATGAACINSEASVASSAAAAFTCCDLPCSVLIQMPCAAPPSTGCCAGCSCMRMPAGQLRLRVPAGHHRQRHLLLLQRHLGAQVGLLRGRVVSNCNPWLSPLTMPPGVSAEPTPASQSMPPSATFLASAACLQRGAGSVLQRAKGAGLRQGPGHPLPTGWAAGGS